jgi:hypothetical protein
LRRIVLISAQRSGTNRFQDLVGRSPNVLALREIFSRAGVFGLMASGNLPLQMLGRRLSVTGLSERDPRAVRFARDHPLELIVLLEDAARALGRDAISLTVMPGDLPDETLRAVLGHRHVTPVLLLRQQLARYVSLVKARHLGRWSRTETTQLKFPLDLPDFRAEAEAVETWFVQIAGLIGNGERIRELRYEDDLLGDDARALERIRLTVPWLAPAEATPPRPRERTRQDLTADVFARIANGREIRAALGPSGVEAACAYPAWRDRVGTLLPDRSISKSGAQA